MHLGLSSLIIFFAYWSQAGDAVTVRIAKGLKRLEIVGQLKSVQGRKVHMSGVTLIYRHTGHWHLVNNNRSMFKFADEKLYLRGDGLRLSGQSIPNSLALISNSAGIHLLARLSMEDYVTGVVASEMPSTWHPEALKAQAIAARSYLIAAKKIGRYKQFDVESSIMDQVYIHARSLNKRVRRAVRQTSKQVLQINSKVLKAHFHSNCGGQTISPKLVWGIGKNAGVIHSCPSRRKSRWSKRLVESELLTRLNRGRKKKISQIFDLKPLLRDRKRVVKVSVASDAGTIHLSGHEFRKLIGFSKLKSTQFKIVGAYKVPKSNGKHEMQREWLIRGQGYGHGVGLCQWGTKHLADSGKSYMEILKYYYPKAEVTEITTKVALNRPGNQL